ncbi:hypothetical protein B0T18DRAFT_2820 [Schizothecium vesticola]|uniref:Uncharacterized protein n=1 Tax=Schizothecium vesticola TaxID=314040 RepID=A0AA40F879_9PEZI|nr:hypothetical protein B0T18DRAFT_2820 [Schizothecium vesticola]
MLQSWAQLRQIRQSPAHPLSSPEPGRQSIGPPKDLEKRQEGLERAGSGHNLCANITDSPGEPFRARPQRLCIPTPRRSHRDHAASIEPTPQRTRAPSPNSACRNIFASRSRLQSRYLARRHPIVDPALVLFLAATGQPRSYTPAKPTLGRLFTIPPFPPSSMYSIPPSPHTDTQTVMSPHHGQRFCDWSSPQMHSSKTVPSLYSHKLALCLGPLGQRCHWPLSPFPPRCHCFFPRGDV